MERIDALRRTFDQTAPDPDFLAEMRRTGGTSRGWR
jgi:hypothetical protein